MVRIHCENSRSNFSIYSKCLGGNDDSEDSDTHDEEEEDEMEVIDGNQAANTTAVTSTMDTSTYTSSPEFFSGAGRSH